MVWEESSAASLDYWADTHTGPGANEARSIAVDKHDETKADRLWAWHETAELFGKDNNTETNRRQQNTRKTKQEMDSFHKRGHRHDSLVAEQAAEGGTLWTALSIRVIRSWKQLNSM